jgi:hypothetical protein
MINKVAVSATVSESNCLALVPPHALTLWLLRASHGNALSFAVNRARGCICQVVTATRSDVNNGRYKSYNVEKKYPQIH